MGGPNTYGSLGRHWAHSQNVPLRFYKASVYEGGACTPAIMHWPKEIKEKGKITAQRGHVIDMMATCLELAGAEYPTEFAGKKLEELESKSLVKILKGELVDRNRAYLFNHSGQHAVIKGDFKIIRRNKKSPWELYNLKENRTETKNLADQMPERIKEMAALWEKRYK
jgi:arylsulfatase